MKIALPRDTDGDGIPDDTDPDDDNDGVPDDQDDFPLLAGLSSDIIQTIAGSGTPTPGPSGNYGGDGGPATSALIDGPHHIVFVTKAKGVLQPGDLLVSDLYNGRVRRIAAVDGVITTLTSDFGDISNEPRGLAIDSNGDVWIGGRHWILKFDPETGVMSREVSMEGITNGNGVAFDSAGNLLIANGVDRVFMLPAGTPTPVAASTLRVVASGGIAPNCVHVATSGVIYACDPPNRRILRVDSDGSVSVVPNLNPLISNGVTTNAAGTLFISNSGGDQIFAYDPITTVSTVIAGTGVSGFNGDVPQPATRAVLDNPNGIQFGPDGRLFFAEVFNDRVRAIGTAVVDTDGDGIPDSSDPDDDNDGVPDESDFCIGTAAGDVVTPGGCGPSDGKIFFARITGAEPSHLWMMTPDGTSQEQLTFGNVYDLDPELSPDGTKLVFSRAIPPAHQSPINYSIWVLDLITGAETPVTV